MFTKTLGRWLLVLVCALAVAGCEDDNSSSDDTEDDWDDDDDVIVTNEPRPELYVVMGDGLSTGVGLGERAPWPYRLERKLKKTVHDAAKGGTRIDYGVANIASILGTYEPSHVLILYGSNDVGAENASDYIAASLLQMVEIAKSSNVIPVIATLPPLYEREGDVVARLRRVNDKIRSMTDIEDVPLADLEAEFGSNRDLIQADGLHPTPEGHEVIATEFYNAVR